MSTNNTNCIRCIKLLTGKQQKFCSDVCGKKYRHKINYRKKWRIINAKAKTRKITKKLKRKFLIEQEVKKREGLKNADLR